MRSPVVATLLALLGIAATLAARRSEDKAPSAALPWIPAGPAGEARLVAPGVLSTPADEVAASFAPDGKDVFFTLRTPSTTQPRLVLCEAHFEHGRWTAPEVVPFSGRFDDTNARLSPDGRKLYFASLRPVDGKVQKDFDLWMVERTAEGWSEPRRLPAPINTPANETAISEAADGTLYFVSDREGGHGGLDIYRLRRDGSGYAAAAENLGDRVNSAFDELQPFVAPDQSLLFFTATGRPEIAVTGGNPYPRGDIYVSVAQSDGWGAARNLGPRVNGTASETNPSLSPDGRMLLFSSERGFTQVPMPAALTYDALEKGLSSLLNGGGNLYAIELDTLGLGPAGRKENR